MKKYLTGENIAILLLSTAVIVMLSILLTKGRHVEANTAARKVLEREVTELKQKAGYLERKLEDGRVRDSLLRNIVNTKRDENKAHIDTASDNELRRLLAN